MLEQYKALGISDAVLTFGEGVLADLKDRFAGIDAIAEANQMKVIAAMQKNRLAANHFNLSSGYGYDDEGRDTLERVYADCFGAEAALVRPQITCGTHALALALGANLLPGDELLSPVGGPYDTLLKRIPKRILTPGEMESFPIDPAAIPADADTVTFVVEEAQAE